jgi:hypothetical protein
VTQWTTFYTMLGSSSAALLGLMFVVIGIVFGRVRGEQAEQGMSVFTTPTTVHFGTALLVSAIVLAPWHSARIPFTIIGVLGAAGLVYMIRVIRRTGRMVHYSADAEDWVWYNIVPFIAYGALSAGGFLALSSSPPALFIAAAAVVLLVFIGIRNAWDLVTYLAANSTE